MDNEKNNKPEIPADSASRSGKIIKTSAIGIAANVFLAAFKAAVGLMSNSIAIILDAVNNISDAASSLITIIGAKLAGKQPDKKHPFGHGRAEYLSSLVISIIILYAGITSLTESIKKIIEPATAEYSTPTLVIVGVAVVVKIVLGLYVRKTGKALNSDSLVNSGTDALFDSIISASTLAAAAIYLIWGISLEAWLGAVISLIIIKSGVGMLRETLSKILGEGTDAAFSREIKATAAAFPGVLGVYDLVVHDYGPDTFQGSLHIEVPDTLTANDVDELTRAISAEVYCRHNVILTAVSVYSRNTTDELTVKTRETVENAVMSEKHIIGMHGFHMNAEEKTMRFDIVVSFYSENRNATYAAAVEKVKKLFPDYSLQVVMDTDYSEE